MTSVEEMETGGELKVKSSSPLESDGDDHQPTELVQKELEDFLPESTEDQDWVSSKKVSMLWVQVAQRAFPIPLVERAVMMPLFVDSHCSSITCVLLRLLVDVCSNFFFPFAVGSSEGRAII